MPIVALVGGLWGDPEYRATWHFGRFSNYTTPSGRIIPVDIFRLTALRAAASVLAVASGIASEIGFG